MGKKKREHVVFDQMLKQKKSIPFQLVNKQSGKKKSTQTLEKS
ncbi:MAG TPA: hypothetical protein PLZ77_01100 [Lachnospiraceae bacterium]|nr:hypothetical protein [Lachnospiraceae bacterium]